MEQEKSKDNAGFIESIREKLGFHKKGRFSAKAMKRRAEKERKRKMMETSKARGNG